MATTYTGVATGLPAASVQITIPADGDNLSAASINGAVQTEANWLEYFRANAALRSQTTTGTNIVGLSITVNGPGVNTNVAGRFDATTVPTSGSTGVQGYGNSYGGDFTSDATNGVAVRGFSSGSAGTGVSGQGGGSGPGVRGTGGANAGPGVRGLGGTGTADGYGGHFTGGGTQAGVYASPGAGASALPAIVTLGSIDFDQSVTPASNVGQKNRLHKQAFSKGGALITCNNSATPTLGDQHNISAVAQNTSTGALQVTLATGFNSSTNYRIIAIVENASWRAVPVRTSNATFTITIYDNSGSAVPYASLNGAKVDLDVSGEQ